MGSRIRRALSRATRAALGACAGATVADVRSDPGGFLAALRSDEDEDDEALDAADDASTA